MSFKFNKSDLKFKDGKLQYESISGWHDNESKCVRNVNNFKVYADYIECAVSYTNYYIADTETGDVFEYVNHPAYLGSVLKDIVEQVREYGAGEVPEKQYDQNEFNPLAGI